MSALGVSAYIALAGLWSIPVSNASMNPARSFAPAIIGGHPADVWTYLTAPFLGAVTAVGIAYLLRGPGGDPGGRKAAQGILGTPQSGKDPPSHPG